MTIEIDDIAPLSEIDLQPEDVYIGETVTAVDKTNVRADKIQTGFDEIRAWSENLALLSPQIRLELGKLNAENASIKRIASSLSTVQDVGYPSLPIPDGTNPISASAFVLGTPAKDDGSLVAVHVYAAAVGDLVISIWDRVEDDFTIASSHNLSVAEIGYQSLVINAAVLAGQYIGCFSNNGLVRFSSGDDVSGWYAGSGDSFTSSSPTYNLPLHIKYEIESISRIDDLSKSVENSNIAVSDLISAFSSSVTLGYPSLPIPDGTNTASSSAFILDAPAPRSGIISKVSYFGAAAGELTISTWSKSGDVFTRESEDVISADHGSQSADVYLAIESGHYVGFFGNGIIRFSSDSGQVGWYAGANGETVTDDAASPGLPLHVQYQIDSLVTYSEIKSDIEGGKVLANGSDNYMIIGLGQSLWEGSDGIVTTTSKYGDLGFPAYPAAPTQLLPATAANTQRPNRGEWPMIGAAEHLQDLCLKSPSSSLAGAQMIIGNNAVSGRPISDLEKGTAIYNNAIAQAAALDGLTEGSSRVMAVSYGQGEQNASISTDPELYLSQLITLANDLDADLRAATGQTQAVPFIIYQMNAIGSAAGKAIGLAHYQSSLDSKLIFCAGPMYPYEYYDSLHITAASSRMVGATHGAAIKAICIDGIDWEPLAPVSAQVIGSDIIMTFNKRGLELDVTTFDEQAGHGFVVKDNAGAVSAITSVSVINSSQVRIKTNGTPSSDWIVSYGVPASGRSDSFGGLMGNLRDSAGSQRKFDGEPLHNWCVVFDYEL